MPAYSFTYTYDGLNCCIFVAFPEMPYNPIPSDSNCYVSLLQGGKDWFGLPYLVIAVVRLVLIG